MICLSLSLILLLPQVADAPAQEPASPPAAPTYDEGPLRVEIMAMREIRYSATDPEMAARLKSEFGMQLRIRGERITQVVRQGNMIFTELVDDTGLNLVDADTYTEQDKTMTRPVMVPAERLRSDGLVLTTRNKPSARGARTLKQVRGSIRLALADKTETLTIDNPGQFVGGTIEDPRLKEMGVEIRVLPADQLENPPPANRCLVLQYATKGDNIQKVSFFDGKLVQVPARETPMTTKSGEACVLQYFDATPYNEEVQAVFEIHPTVEEVNVPFEMDDVALP